MYGWFSGLLTLRNGLSIFDAGEDEVCFEKGFDAGIGQRSSSTGTRGKMPSIGSRPLFLATLRSARTRLIPMVISRTPNMRVTSKASADEW